ncbi:hypothetical protein CA606_18230 [Caulobacter vibrioides]|uniref:DUF2163 domain-containing protein n=1 Tax=Caulobacter vibrioides TaxID=155892 RepID=A0A290MW45_CAUVI|nr:hypothetical protein [Caulobacter vibrioides]ATC34112.1 hypothetical protein CA606_18230 [Caulobacter vibrioides]
MKVFSTAALEALEAGGAIVTGAVQIVTAPNPVQVWGGFGVLTLGDLVFQGIGDRGLAQVSAGALGGAAQETTLTLSGLEPAVLALLDQTAIRNAPTVIWRLLFDRNGQTLLDAKVFTRGRLDQLVSDETVGGEATLSAMIEGAARGLGRFRGRMRSAADQQLNAPGDDGFKAVSYAGTKTIYWGGKIPSTVTSVTYPAVVAGGYLDKFQE